MITFNLLVNNSSKWNLYLKNDSEMKNIYYGDQEPEDGMSINGVTEYITSSVYISKKLNGFMLIKTLRHELMHIYLYELGKRDAFYSEDEVCEILADAMPIIDKTTDEILLKLRNGGNKNE